MVEEGFSSRIQSGEKSAEPRRLALIFPYSKVGASSEVQTTPASLFETSSQRWKQIQLRLPALSWSFSTSITPHGMSTRVRAAGKSKAKPKWTPSLFVIAILSTRLSQATSGEPALTRTSRVRRLQPSAFDSTRSEATKGPVSFTDTFTSVGPVALDPSLWPRK